jgi:ribosomal protein S18 acetylase RimI-like enzyme
MTQAQYTDFMGAIFPVYVAERAAADHVSLLVAEQYVRRQHTRLLPEGHLTVGHRFVRVLSTESGQAVGGVWFSIDDENKQAFLYYITIASEHRRRGFAGSALIAVEEAVRAVGCISFGLNVFSSNDGAIALYRKLGFRTVSSYLNKQL